MLVRVIYIPYSIFCELLFYRVKFILQIDAYCINIIFLSVCFALMLIEVLHRCREYTNWLLKLEHLSSVKVFGRLSNVRLYIMRYLWHCFYGGIVFLL